MQKVYDHTKYEGKIYSLWEKSGAFTPSETGKPYTILMPPPNANASLHAGHAMYTVDDILIRYKRMRGFSSLWIPGMDHAGFETQFVYEKGLAKEGKSRMDFDRETLHKNIAKFVEENSGLIYKQFKRLGFSADWKRGVYAAEKSVVDYVNKTFEKMEKDGLVYRDGYIVNYCTHCGTSLAELEAKHIERVDPLYYVKYKIVGKGNQYLAIATARPETIFADSAIAVNPNDKKYKNLPGLEVVIPLLNKKIPIITDAAVEVDFGTGALKVTPAHDPVDFEIGKRHKLKQVSIINLRGKLVAGLPWLDGKNIKNAREETVKRLEECGALEKVDHKYSHTVAVCYKCNHDLEPTVIPNWFIKVKNLKEKVREAVEKDRIKFYPKKFKLHMLAWLDVMHDWPISRQIAWAIRIPAWYNIDKNPEINIVFLDNNKLPISGKARELLDRCSFDEIKSGLQSLTAPTGASYKISTKSPGKRYLQETDTFDTWFSSGQWPLFTLKSDEFDQRFPTDVLATLSDILKFWVSRMIMFSLYLKNEVPFKNVYLWSAVADSKGVKMSKSRGNVINPIGLIDKYGADALRMSLIYGTPAGSKVILSEDKVRAMRNFANKIWNIARFTLAQTTPNKAQGVDDKNKNDKWILGELEKTVKQTTKSLEEYRLNEAAEEVYGFVWHKFADCYLETFKKSKYQNIEVLRLVLATSIRLLHPFMPFVTEALWKETGHNELLISAKWPTSPRNKETA